MDPVSWEQDAHRRYEELVETKRREAA